jgi:thymidylate synthase
MRSNDAILGLPYDVFLFTMLQELLACELGITLGVYHHVAGSLHIYERNLELGQRIVDAGPGSEFQMPPMNSPTEIPTFLFFEDLIRRGGAQSSSEFSGLSPFWHDLLTVLLSFWKLRRAPSIELADPHQGFMYETFIPLFGKP